jgi:hypothetical protein
MAQFLGVVVDHDRIRSTVKDNSLERMRAKEDSSRKYDPKSLGRQTGEEHRFVRKGSVGGWRERLTDAQLSLIDEFAGPVLARLGYPTGDAVFLEQTSGSVCQ